MNIENFPLNVELFYLINHARSPILDTFFGYFYLLGKGYVLIPIAFILIVSKNRRWKLFLLSVAVESAAVHLLKFGFDAPRPASMLTDVYLLEPLYHRSFPSGDTAMAFLIASFFFPVSPPLVRVLLWAYAFLIAYGRIYMGVHFPLDVIAGATIGALSYKLCERLVHSKLIGWW